jgi:hypothetical protein
MDADSLGGAPWVLTLLMIPLFFFIGWASKGYFEPASVTQYGIGAGPALTAACSPTPTEFITPTVTPAAPMTPSATPVYQSPTNM